MSLFKQLIIAICLFLVIAFSGSFMVSLESSRAQYVNQLRSHAQDAATALAVSLTPNIDDPAMTELMVSSIFDSGYYASIRVIDLATGKPIVERSAEPNSEGVPHWFARLAGLEGAGGDAIVSRGWQQAARVEVVSHPMFALAKLWQSALGSLGWLALCGVASAVLGALLLRRQLRPLDYMVEQSHAIGRREFLSLPELPRTPELRRVVQAMNQMVEKLKALFNEQAERTERLRSESYQDSLTGLANRRHFDMQLPERLSGAEDNDSGYLLVVRVCDLAGLNQRLGGQKVDELLCAVAQLLTRGAAQFQTIHDLIARSRGGEFAMLAPGMNLAEARQFSESLERGLLSLAQTGASDATPVALLGWAAYRAGDEPRQLFHRADQALAQAQANGQAAVFVAADEHGAGQALEGHHAWHERLDQALQQGRFELFFQPVAATREPMRRLHYKVLSRLQDESGQPMPAGRFLPWIERFGWAGRLDRLMLDKTLEHLATHDQILALNLSASTLADPVALEQLCERIARHAAVAPRLVLEIAEEHLPAQAVLTALAKRLHGLGCGLALQHFGGRFSIIGNLAQLGLAYLKVDGSYIRAIDEDGAKRLFLDAIQRAAHSIDVPLVAERVETEAEALVIAQMGIQGMLGRYVAEPAPWQL